MAATKTVQLCCLSIGYNNYLMPMDKAMKVMELMQSAVSCNKEYSGGSQFTYSVGDQPQCGLDMVKPSQVNTPSGAEITPIPVARKRLAGARS